MKKRIIRIISVITALAVMLPAVSLLLKTEAGAYPGRVPVICIYGEDTPLGIRQADGFFEPVTATIDTAKAAAMFTDNAGVIAKAVVTQDWTEVCDLITDFLIDTYKDLVLDENGVAANGSESVFTYSKPDLQRYFTAPNSDLWSYGFRYDWRLDPYDNMEKLRTFIEDVLDATGCTQYALYGRCLGACLEATYYDIYKDDRITDIIVSHSGLLGMTPIGEAFSGNLVLDGDAAERFAYEYDMGLNLKVTDGITLTDDSIRQMLKILSDTYNLDMFCWFSTNVYQHIYDYINPRLLKHCFGSFPGYWAMCEDKYYEDAKKVVFAGEEEKYANFINKIDHYHNTIMLRAEDILKEAQSNGIKVSCLVKYGQQLLPLIEDANALSDQLLKVSVASFGAYTVGNDTYFTDDYIQSETEKGNGAYLSPDRKINASSCLFRDTTWFIKNVGHKENPVAVNKLIFAIVNDENATVDTLEGFPQFLYYDKENEDIVPLDPSVHISKSDEFNANIADSFIRKIKKIFRPVFIFATWVVKYLFVKPRAGK